MIDHFMLLSATISLRLENRSKNIRQSRNDRNNLGEQETQKIFNIENLAWVKISKAKRRI